MNDSSGSAFLKHFGIPQNSRVIEETAEKILDHPSQLMPPPTNERSWEDYNLETLKHVLVLLFPQDIHSRARLYALIVVQIEENAAFVRSLSNQQLNTGN